MFKRMWRVIALLSMSSLLLSSGCWGTLFDWQKISQAAIMADLFD
jgi:hypothetical protein